MGGDRAEFEVGALKDGRERDVLNGTSPCQRTKCIVVSPVEGSLDGFAFFFEDMRLPFGALDSGCIFRQGGEGVVRRSAKSQDDEAGDDETD